MPLLATENRFSFSFSELLDEEKAKEKLPEMQQVQRHLQQPFVARIRILCLPAQQKKLKL